MPKIEVKKKKIEIKVGAGKIYPALTDLNVIPSAEQQVFTHEGEYGYDKVTVEGIQDENLKAENIKKGVNILGVEGNFNGIKYQPRYLYQPISFRDYTGTELEHETTMLDTTYLTTLKDMFYNCYNLTSLNITEWHTENVTNMNGMFFNCKNILELDLRHFNTSNVMDIGNMFKQCSGLTSLDLRGWDTSNVTSMSATFQQCSKLTSLDLSSWDTSNVTNMYLLFYLCSSLKYLDIRNFNFDKVTSSTFIFVSVPKDCLIIVKGDSEKQWVLTQRNDLTNVKTVAELGDE